MTVGAGVTRGEMLHNIGALNLGADVPLPARRTIISFGRLAVHELRLKAAREGSQGLQIMTIEQFAARLAGGFSQAVQMDSLRAAVQSAIPKADLDELERIKHLPGFVKAAVDTISKVWLAGIDLQARRHEHARIASLASLEQAVLQELPASQLRPTDLAEHALARQDHIPAIFGKIDIQGLTELSPCWRPLLQGAASHTQVRWISGPRRTPDWLDTNHIQVHSSQPHEPQTHCVNAATAYHEAIEAVRWARQLIASGTAKPHEIAIASAAASDYDDHLLALRSDATIDIHFAHGVKVAASREGQAAAALADILLRGLSQSRMRRLATLLRVYQGPFQELPKRWANAILPIDAPLSSAEAWYKLIDHLSTQDWPDGIDHGPQLKCIISTLARGLSAAAEIGEEILRAQPLAVWRKALLAGPPPSLHLTLETLRRRDDLDPSSSIVWSHPGPLAAAPRPFVYLLGLNSQRWPHSISEDRLLSDHIIPTMELDPLPAALADSRDFHTILATTKSQIVLSLARRDAEGRLLGRSGLLQGHPEGTYLRRHRIPEHAFSETDRLTARPQDFRELAQAAATSACWRNWHRYKEITPHDGKIRPDHPVIQGILQGTQSASSLRMLLRNPLGYVWRYGLGLSEPMIGEDPLTLDALAFGDLVHQTLERTLVSLESDGGLATLDEQHVMASISAAAQAVAGEWEVEQPIPPRIIWQRTLREAERLSATALVRPDEEVPLPRAYAEVPFGGETPQSPDNLPWDASIQVDIPATGMRIRGYIDRLDLSAGGDQARVRDYKTGKAPKKDMALDGGKELQRCLYAYAVRAILGESTHIEASLHYLREDKTLVLPEPEVHLASLAHYLQTAKVGLIKGNATIGTDAGARFDDLAFALPANAGAVYCARKAEAAQAQLGSATHVWDEP